MFLERAKFYNRVQFVSDLLLTCIAFPLAYVSRTYISDISHLLPSNLGRFFNPLLLPFYEYLWIIGLGILWWTITAFSLGLYRISIRRFGWEKVRIIIESSILLWLFIGILSYTLKQDISRPLIVLFVFYQAVLLLSSRLVQAVEARRGKGFPPDGECRNIVIIGSGSRAHQMGELIARYSDWGLQILGYVNMGTEEFSPSRDDVLGSIADLDRITNENVIDEFIYVGERTSLEGLDKILELCQEQGIRLRVAANFFPVKVAKLSMEFLENVPIITFSSNPDYVFSLLLKRALDIIIASAGLILLMPVFVVVGLLVKCTSKGPMIYRQVRCGLFGRKFTLYKFRSMYDGADDILWEIKHLNEMNGPTFKMRNDPRVTGIGRFLRKSSIDEWPQLWNVLRGDMSLVGPRAPLPDEVKEYLRWQRRRLSVKPGMTCLWQISGRSEIDFHEWMKLDLHYIDNWSFALDLKILLYTLPAVLFGKGAR